jgi:hypothetical protein
MRSVDLVPRIDQLPSRRLQAASILLHGHQREPRTSTIAIVDVIDENAPKMPEYYPKIDDLKNVSYSWIHSQWVEKCTDSELLAKQINDAVRAYFDTDNLLPRVAKVGRRWHRLFLHRIKHGNGLYVQSTEK